jgi:uncharacterized protein (DUF2384 family)
MPGKEKKFSRATGKSKAAKALAETALSQASSRGTKPMAASALASKAKPFASKQFPVKEFPAAASVLSWMEKSYPPKNLTSKAKAVGYNLQRIAEKQAITTGDGFRVAEYALMESMVAKHRARHFRWELRTADLTTRVEIERTGVPHDVIKELIGELGASTAEFQQMVGMPKATFAKKIAHKEFFSGVSGQSVVGLMDMINMAEDMLDQQNPDVANFDVEAWVGHWIRTPQPALGGETPASLMDTPSGRQSVMRVLGAMASGAYL